MRQRTNQSITQALHALDEDHQHHHRGNHHFIVETLIAVTDRQITEPATAGPALEAVTV